jgi:hypothetical protein
MAVSITATSGSATANSFVTLAEMATFMEARLNAALWDAAIVDTQNRALVEATRELSSLTWPGGRSTTTQALAWPREWVQNPDSTPFTWSYYTTTEIPQRVKDATCELAFQFVNAGTTDVAALDPNVGVIEKTIDVLTTRWQPYQKPAVGLARYPRVMNYIRPLLLAVGATTPTVRG